MSGRRWWYVWVSGPGADYWRCRVHGRTWYDAGVAACNAAAVQHGHRPERYHVRGIRPEVKAP